MKWTSKDIAQYVQAKEYIDTAIIPLISISFKDDEIKNSASHGEYISILSLELERQFKGRVLLLPSYSYYHNNSPETKLQSVNEYIHHIKKEMKHVFLLTSDSSWTKSEEELEGKLLWLPAIPLEDMEEKYKMKIVQDQMNQLLPMFIQKWQ
ncbi:YpiF family protein [Sutcliffiella deserti]|uniref:YpiF family protein n=1 Tax=Sutcliffiella deserti TaxID=2875501 RepID=UPI001CC03F9D|nr:YpiF family protein [Sutcliffiella deserti]